MFETHGVDVEGQEEPEDEQRRAIERKYAAALGRVQDLPPTAILHEYVTLLNRAKDFEILFYRQRDEAAQQAERLGSQDELIRRFLSFISRYIDELTNEETLADNDLEKRKSLKHIIKVMASTLVLGMFLNFSFDISGLSNLVEHLPSLTRHFVDNFEFFLYLTPFWLYLVGLAKSTKRVERSKLMLTKLNIRLQEEGIRIAGFPSFQNLDSSSAADAPPAEENEVE